MMISVWVEFYCNGKHAWLKNVLVLGSSKLLFCSLCYLKSMLVRNSTGGLYFCILIGPNQRPPTGQITACNAGNMNMDGPYSISADFRDTDIVKCFDAYNSGNSFLIVGWKEIAGNHSDSDPYVGIQLHAWSPTLTS